MSSGNRDEILAGLGREVTGLQADQELFDSAVAELSGLNRTDWRCLDMLFTRGPMTAGALAEAANLTTGAVTAVLDHLEARGFVRRIRDTKDRRKVIVEVTDEMWRSSEPVYGPLMEDSEKSLRVFDVDQLATIVEFVRLERELIGRHTARVRTMLRDRAAPSSPDAGAPRRSREPVEDPAGRS